MILLGCYDFWINRNLLGLKILYFSSDAFRRSWLRPTTTYDHQISFALLDLVPQSRFGLLFQKQIAIKPFRRLIMLKLLFCALVLPKILWFLTPSLLTSLILSILFCSSPLKCMLLDLLYISLTQCHGRAHIDILVVPQLVLGAKGAANALANGAYIVYAVSLDLVQSYRVFGLGMLMYTCNW